MAEIPQKDLVTQTALADQQRRAQLEADKWDAEFNFWHRIISEEVERFRFNEGYEPVWAELYAAKAHTGLAFIGKTQIGHTQFRVTGRWAYDARGKKILKIEILKAP